MVQTVQNQLPNRHQFAAQELLQISETLQKIYLDQLDYLVSVTVDNFFQFNVQNHTFSVANDFLKVHIDEEVGVIFKLDLNDGCSRYELAHSEEHHRHHHLVCNECKAVYEVQDDLLEELEERIETTYGFRILDHSVKFFGICAKCCKKHKCESEE